MGRVCLRDPIPEIYEAANDLDLAVSAHLNGDAARAEDLIRRADIPAIARWTDSLWGKAGPWTRPLQVDNPLPKLSRDQRIKMRMPPQALKKMLVERDGFHCRFCGIPLVRQETRSLIRRSYPLALRWGTVQGQHAAFEAMWLQYDHVVPHARGGSNDETNMLITCAPCNYGRNDMTLDEAGLVDPRTRDPVRAAWDGLERFARPTLTLDGR